MTYPSMLWQLTSPPKMTGKGFATRPAAYSGVGSCGSTNNMMLHAMFILAGIVAGAIVGANFGRPFGVAAAVAGGFLGASAGLGPTLLHRRIVLWILGPSKPETDTKMTRIEERICTPIYGLGMTCGYIFSWFGTVLTVAFLVPKEPKPGELSRGQCLLISSSIALCGYLLLWGAQRLVDWIESRHTPPGP